MYHLNNGYSNNNVWIFFELYIEALSQNYQFEQVLLLFHIIKNLINNRMKLLKAYLIVTQRSLSVAGNEIL